MRSDQMTPSVKFMFDTKSYPLILFKRSMLIHLKSHVYVSFLT